MGVHPSNIMIIIGFDTQLQCIVFFIGFTNPLLARGHHPAPFIFHANRIVIWVDLKDVGSTWHITSHIWQAEENNIEQRMMILSQSGALLINPVQINRPWKNPSDFVHCADSAKSADVQVWRSDRTLNSAQSSWSQRETEEVSSAVLARVPVESTYVTITKPHL